MLVETRRDRARKRRVLVLTRTRAFRSGRVDRRFLAYRNRAVKSPSDGAFGCRSIRNPPHSAAERVRRLGTPYAIPIALFEYDQCRCETKSTVDATRSRAPSVFRFDFVRRPRPNVSEMICSRKPVTTVRRVLEKKIAQPFDYGVAGRQNETDRVHYDRR